MLEEVLGLQEALEQPDHLVLLDNWDLRDPKDLRVILGLGEMQDRLEHQARQEVRVLLGREEMQGLQELQGILEA